MASNSSLSRREVVLTKTDMEMQSAHSEIGVIFATYEGANILLFSNLPSIILPAIENEAVKLNGEPKNILAAVRKKSEGAYKAIRSVVNAKLGSTENHFGLYLTKKPVLHGIRVYAKLHDPD